MLLDQNTIKLKSVMLCNYNEINTVKMTNHVETNSSSLCAQDFFLNSLK